MKERPIPFSAPMVRAILEGRKTVTRRVVKPQPANNQGMVNARYCGHPHEWLRDGICLPSDAATEWCCPYGKPGDRLWVREAWKSEAVFNLRPPRDIPVEAQLFYLADSSPAPETSRYRHARFMPRWASRITLELTSVRADRLLSLTYEDAVAEGVVRDQRRWYADDQEGMAYDVPQGAFSALWESINGPGSWHANPWVWVVEFKRVEAPKA